MQIDKGLEQELLTRLLHAGPGGLGKEILDNYRGGHEVAEALSELQTRGWIQDRKADADWGDPFKLTAAGAEAARQYESH
jgi:hypothetical protein